MTMRLLRAMDNGQWTMDNEQGTVAGQRILKLVGQVFQLFIGKHRSIFAHIG